MEKINKNNRRFGTHWSITEILVKDQCATGNPVSVPVDPATFFRSGSDPVPAKY